MKEASRFSLSSPEFQRLELVEPRTKVGLLDEGYEYVLKSKGFTQDLTSEIWEIEVGLRKVSQPVSTL